VYPGGASTPADTDTLAVSDERLLEEEEESLEV
jgi:hypothetical protein